jgi:hypothetical protein
VQGYDGPASIAPVDTGLGPMVPAMVDTDADTDTGIVIDIN